MIINPVVFPSFGKEIGLDIETNGVSPWLNDILVISITTRTQTYVLEVGKYTHERIKDILSRIVDLDVLVIGQNIKFDCGFIYAKYGLLITNTWDTMLASQITTNGKNLKYSLPEIINRDLGEKTYESDMKKFYQRSFLTQNQKSSFTKEQLQYAADDTKYLLRLYDVQKEKIKELGLDNIMKLERKLLPVLTKMEVVGCRIDTQAWLDEIHKVWEVERLECVKKLDQELVELSKIYPRVHKRYLKPRKTQTYDSYDLFTGTTRITTETSYSFNFASSAQIIDLFKLCGEPVPTVKDNDGAVKESVGADSLGLYITEYPRTKMRRFIDLVLEYRKFEKLLSTYGPSFLEQLDNNSYIHTTYSQCFTKTGRLSSRSPNLQNIPPELRKFFIPDKDHVMITCDMQAAEVRIAADYSNEEKLVNSILLDEDLHSLLASKSFSIIFGEKVKIDKSDNLIKVGEFEFKARTLRDIHKSVLFAKFYKGGAKRVYEVLSYYINLFHPEDQMQIADKISKAIDKELPNLTKYLSEIIEKAQKTGELRGSKLGRLRYFDSNVYGEAANNNIQNTNSEALKIAMIKIDNFLTENNYGRLVLNVHDEVVCSVVKEHAIIAGEFIKKTMAESLGWFLTLIPGDASYEISDRWKK